MLESKTLFLENRIRLTHHLNHPNRDLDRFNYILQSTG